MCIQTHPLNTCAVYLLELMKNWCLSINKVTFLKLATYVETYHQLFIKVLDMGESFCSAFAKEMNACFDRFTYSFVSYLGVNRPVGSRHAFKTFETQWFIQYGTAVHLSVMYVLDKAKRSRLQVCTQPQTSVLRLRMIDQMH